MYCLVVLQITVFPEVVPYAVFTVFTVLTSSSEPIAPVLGLQFLPHLSSSSSSSSSPFLLPCPPYASPEGNMSFTGFTLYSLSPILFLSSCHFPQLVFYRGHYLSFEWQSLNTFNALDPAWHGICLLHRREAPCST